jgi:NADH-quinone oxidoreductase subunit C
MTPPSARFHPLRKEFPLAGKDSGTPDVAFSRAAPLAGGPFVTSPTGGDTQHHESRSREME